jgi:hypothetical protein
MKRDWDVIRQVLIEVESLSEESKYDKRYGLGREHDQENRSKSEQALLLWKAGFLDAVDVGTLAGPAIAAPELTWKGHELLDTIRSKPVWEKIKVTAREKGIDLTFDAVIALGKFALASILGGGSGT